MDARKIIRGIVRWLLIDQVIEFVYWIAALVGLVKLGSTLDSTTMLVIVIPLYCVGVTAVYFFVLKKLKWQ
ncbi:MAG: hypothetical protein HY820_10070 [Acidobacteria bacterium]|nr:hypothetical protein [Acidobacteriota bacterium]